MSEKSTGAMHAPSSDRTLCSPYFDVTAFCDISEEFTLADYFPEIKRVISAKAKALPEGKFLSGNTVDCDGVVAFTVTYLGDDDSVAAASFTAEYSQSINFPDLPEGASGNPCACDTVVESASCRVTDPRRITLKAHLRTRAFADMVQNGEEVCTDEKGGSVSGADLLSVERYCEKKKSVHSVNAALTSRVEGPLHGIDGGRVISADGAVNVIDAHGDFNRIFVRGEVIVFVLCQGEDGVWTQKREKLPFEEVLDAPGTRAGDQVRAHGRAASVSVSSTSQGIGVEVEFDLDAQSLRGEDTAVCTDAYSTAFDSEIRTREWEIYTPLKCTVLHLTATGDVKRKSARGDGEQLIGGCASAEIEKAEVSKGRLTLSGNVVYQAGVAQNGDVYPEEGKIPFTVSTDVDDSETENPVWRSDVQVIDLSGRCNDGNISVTAELAISVFAADRKKVSMVDMVILDKGSPKKRKNGVRIYFPDGNESVWSIAKKYFACRRTLEKLNGWAEGTVSAGTAPVVIE